MIFKKVKVEPRNLELPILEEKMKHDKVVLFFVISTTQNGECAYETEL